MHTRQSTRRHGAPEVLLGTVTWSMLLVLLLAAVSLPELGGWPNWLWTFGR